MSLLNQLNCTSDVGNTGVGVCSLDFKKIVGAILTPKGYTIAAADLADSASLLAKLQADCQASSKAARIYPVMGFVNAEDNSTGLQKQTFSYGVEAPVRDGINNWAFQFIKGGLSLLQKLRLFNKSSAYDFLFVDDENKILGTASADGTGLKAIPSMYFWARQWKANTGQAVSEYTCEFAFLPQYVNEYVAAVSAGFDIPTNIVGLQEVTVTGIGSATAGTYNLTALAGGTNMGDLYATELAAVGAWVATNSATGGVIPITGATYNATSKIFVLVLTTGNANYPAVGGSLSINLAAVSVLAGLGVDGYESSNPAQIVRN